MSQEYFNETDKDVNKQIVKEDTPNYGTYNNNDNHEEEEENDYIDNKQNYNIEENSSHSRHSSHHYNNDNDFDSGSTYSYSTGSNLIRLSQPSSAVHIHFSGSSAASKSSKKSSKKRNGESSGCYIHLEPSTIERDLNSDKIFNVATNTKPKKNSKPHPQQQQQQKQIQQQPQYQVQVQPQDQQQIQKRHQQQMPQQMQRQSPQQRNPNQRKIIDDSPDSYQVSDKFVDRDINLSDNNNNSNEYTYEYISESNSYYKRNLPRIQALQRQQQLQQNSPASNLENDSEYTYVYDYPSSELEDQSAPRNGFENRIRNNNQTPNNYNYSNRNVPPNAFQYNNNDIDDYDSEYTYTYDSVSSFNDQYQNLPQNQQQQPQQRTINAKLVPQGMRNKGAPLVPIQMNIRAPIVPDESTNDYTYTYDEPTTEEKMLIESMKNRDIPLPSPSPKQNVNNYSISKIPQVEIPPAKPKKNPNNKYKKNKKLSPREKKIQQKISKLQKNLDKLENVSDEEEEETVDINDNKKVNLLKNKIADLTGWRNSPRNGQIGSYGTNSYTYTFEYESEVFPQKKEPAELRLVSPIGSVSIEAAKQPSQTVVERNFLMNDEPAKISLEISPAVQSESSNMNAASNQKKKAEQLQEIFELKKKLQQLQQQVNYNEDENDDDNENFSYEPQSSSSTADNQDQAAASGSHNKIRVKKRVRVAKQVKLSNGLKQQQQQGDVKKLKKVQKRVRVEKNTSHHHHHHSHRRDRQADNSEPQIQQKDDREFDEEFVTKDVLLDEDSESYENQNQSQNESETAASTASTYRNSATSEALQLLDESSSPHSSTVMPQFTSPKSPLHLLDEGSDDNDNEEANQQSLKVKVVEVENMPDVACFCVAFIDSTGDARKTSVAARGSPKEFDDDVLSFPLKDVDEGEVNNLVVLVKRHDLIKNDRLLGTAKVEIDLQSLRSGNEIEKRVQLISDAGIPTQSQVHIIMSLNDIAATSEDTKNASPHTVEFVTMPIQETVTREGISPCTNDFNTRSVHFTSEEEDIDDQQPQPQQQQLRQHQKPQSLLHHSDENNEEEEEDDQEPLNPSNVKLTSDMKNRLKIHRNFNALKSNDESGVFILEAPSQSPLDAEFDQNPSSSFITDLVRQRSIDNESKNSRSSNSSSKAKNRSNVNFSKSDKITYNLENDVRLNQRAQQRGAGIRGLDADEASESGGNSDQIRKKRRTIQKIEATSREGQINKEPIQIEIDFASNSNSFPDYYSGQGYEIDG